ncbi:DinB family protein [Paracrocinitomix mangrovi]|uniref:DinB family protein n=1 Tax=Paracrocinitomix mangrovi TaxID=2862509 RepID=UPI001C8D124B|nr:DinB family protein [Paracrocinitomix mangrovi]UKN01901.1 DinB family protein [Paracrocinitomix mangrovi]
MDKDIEIFQYGRNFIIDITSDLTLDQLNIIPEGFTGNIAWHLGHMAVTHKGLIYALNSGKVGLPKEFIKKYSRGGKPDGPIDQEERDFIYQLLKIQIEELPKDLNTEGFFGQSYPYETPYGYIVDSLEKAVKFSSWHQSMHIGYIMALKHLV